MNNILVTGGCGFIGSHIVDYLLEKKYFVRVFDNLSTGNMNNIHQHNNNPNFEFLFGDLVNLDDIRRACHGMDTICHQGALGSVIRSIDNPLLTHNNNATGFVNLLTVAKEKGIKRIVYASSSSVYGDNDDILKNEDVIGNALSPYAITKHINELYANIFTKLYGLECIGLRYFNVFGPRQNPNGMYACVIPKFLSAIKNNGEIIIYGNGDHSRDFTYVANVVNANYLALTTTNDKCFGNIFNIGSADSTSILELFNAMKKYTKSSLKPPTHASSRVGDMLHTKADISKSTQYLNYYPSINFNQGLELTIKYFLSDKSSITID